MEEVLVRLARMSVVTPTRFEPMASGLGILRSILLSYGVAAAELRQSRDGIKPIAARLVGLGPDPDGGQATWRDVKTPAIRSGPGIFAAISCM